MNGKKRFRVAFSFPGEMRDYVADDLFYQITQKYNLSSLYRGQTWIVQALPIKREFVHQNQKIGKFVSQNPDR